MMEIIEWNFLELISVCAEQEKQITRYERQLQRYETAIERDHGEDNCIRRLNEGERRNNNYFHVTARFRKDQKMNLVFIGMLLGFLIVLVILVVMVLVDAVSAV